MSFISEEGDLHKVSRQACLSPPHLKGALSVQQGLRSWARHAPDSFLAWPVPLHPADGWPGPDHACPSRKQAQGLLLLRVPHHSAASAQEYSWPRWARGCVCIPRGSDRAQLGALHLFGGAGGLF